MKVKTFNIIDRLPYGIVAHYEPSASAAAGSGDQGEAKEDVAVLGSSAAIYSKGDEVSVAFILNRVFLFKYKCLLRH